MIALVTPLPMAAGEPQLSGIAAWTVSVMEALGSFGVAVLVAAENLFPPIPSEIILPLAGFTASRGSFSLITVLVWATVGSLVGALALYGVGAALGRERTRKIMGALPLVKISDVDKTEKFFDKHGTYTVFFGRQIPIFRSLISIPAGVTRMPMLTFMGLTALGSLLWNTALILAGYYLGENWHLVEKYVGVLTYVVAGLVVLLIVLWVAMRLKSRHATESTPSS
ncbi:DedA family protein [Bowdeniella nasicola]|nr:DedA family protein [Bowdeniella nasicola]